MGLLCCIMLSFVFHNVLHQSAKIFTRFHPEKIFFSHFGSHCHTFPLLLKCVCSSLSQGKQGTQSVLREKRETQPATFRHIPGFVWIKHPLFCRAYF